MCAPSLRVFPLRRRLPKGSRHSHSPLQLPLVAPGRVALVADLSLSFRLERRVERTYVSGLATTGERVRWVAVRESDGKQLGTGPTRRAAREAAEALLADVALLRS